MVTDLIGFAAGILLMFSFLPQVITTFRTKTAEDISMTMLVVTFSSAVLYEVYAARLGLVPVIIMNGVFAVLVAIEIALKIRYAPREG